MPAARLVLLGPPVLMRDERPITPVTRKSLALLALLHEEGTLTRARAAALLWGDREDEAARHNLRQELYRLSKVVPDLVVVDGPSLGLAPDVTSDVREAQAAYERGDVDAALRCRGEFLEGVEADDAAFGEWLTARRSQRGRLRVEWLREAANHAVRAGNGARARALLEEAVRLDAWREDVWRELLVVLAREGRHDEVTSAYGRLRDLLASELGVEPHPATRELFERSRAQGSAPAAAPVKEALRAARAAARLHQHAAVLGSMREVLSQLHDDVERNRPFIARACDLLFSSASALGDTAAMEEATARLRALARLDLAFEAACVASTAALWLRLGRFADVRDLTRECWDEREHRDGEWSALVWRGVALLRLGDLAGARDVLSFAARGRLPAVLRVEAALGLGAAALNTGRLDEAGEHFTVGLRLARGTGNVPLTVRARSNLGVWHLVRGDQEGAARLLTRAAEDAVALSQPAMTRMILVNLFKAQYELGRFEDASRTLGEAFSTLRDAPDPYVEGALLNNQGALSRARGAYGEALDALTGAIDNALATEHKMQQARRFLARADVLLELGATQAAYDDLAQAEALVTRHGLSEVEPWMTLLHAEAALRHGHLGTCASRLHEVSLVLGALAADDRSRWRCCSAALALVRGDEDAALAALADPPDPMWRARHLTLRVRAKRVSNLDVSHERDEARSWLRDGRLIVLDEIRVRAVLMLGVARVGTLVGVVRASLESRPSVREAFERHWSVAPDRVPV